MMITNRRLSLLTVVLGLGLAAGLTVVEAQDEEKPLIDYRQRLMRGQSASMGSIGDIMKFKMFSSEHLAQHASNISGYAKLIPEAFEKSVTMGPTDAKPEIWENWDDFVAKSEALVEAGDALAEAARAGGDPASMMTQVRAIGDACGGCHDSYRKPDEESYKR